MIKGFREFLLKNSVLALAIGFIMGAATGKVVSSLVADIIMPLISRVLPDVWHTAPDVSNQRLSYPVTYWNTLGLLAALGIVLSFHLACSLGERRSVRVLAAAVLPVLAATLFFTFSRGAIAAGAIGLLVYVLVARPHALLSGALATAPCTAALILAAYHANLLDTVDRAIECKIDREHLTVTLQGHVCHVAPYPISIEWPPRWLRPYARRRKPSLRMRRARPSLST